MSESEHLAFLAATVPDYAADKVASGEWTAEKSLDLAKQSFDSPVPEGLQTEPRRGRRIGVTPIQGSP